MTLNNTIELINPIRVKKEIQKSCLYEYKESNEVSERLFD